jgi:hypothetical protein
MYRFPRLLTTLSSGSRFEFPLALVVKASHERKFSSELNSFIKKIFFLILYSSYRSEYIEPMASYSYRSDVIHKHYHIYSLSLLGKQLLKEDIK